MENYEVKTVYIIFAHRIQDGLTSIRKNSFDLMFSDFKSAKNYFKSLTHNPDVLYASLCNFENQDYSPIMEGIEIIEEYFKNKEEEIK